MTSSKEPALQYRRCLWLLNTIYAHGPITREGIMEYWRDDDEANPYGTYEIPIRTFQKSLRAIEDYFGLTVYCNRRTNEYTVLGAKEAGMKRTRKVTMVDLASAQLQHPDVSSLPAQLFRIDVLEPEVERLREHPLCPEQREVSVDTETGNAIFEYFMKPSMQWYEAVRSLGIAVKVLYPQWLVDVIREDMQTIANMYWEDVEEKNEE